jgi:predicted Rossmann fold flavoprotein
MIRLFQYLIVSSSIILCESLSNGGFKIGVIGGGASGMFAACSAASTGKCLASEETEIHVLEASSKLMTKVEISGGGRCNVLHDTSKPVSNLLNGYPRGKKELQGLLHKHFSPKNAEEWFRSRGVDLKTESDGRMFPTTDSSQTIMNCIMDSARQNGVKIRTRQKVSKVQYNESRQVNSKPFTVEYFDEEKQIKSQDFDAIIIATGSNPLGYDIASSLHHTIIPPVPSLFTFNTKNQNKDGQVFYGLAGVSVPMARTTLKIKIPNKKKLKTIDQEGPLLITHHGLSGPAVLRLSAFAAREMKGLNYQTEIGIHWAPEFGSAQDIEEMLWKITSISPKKAVSSVCPLMILDEEGASTSAIPRRLWYALCIESGIEKSTIWGEASKKKIGALSRNIAEFKADVTGKGVFKDEFVTAGGVCLKDVDMKTMESKLVKGLYFCGEVLDVDGVTGGFNFMNCWSTGYVSGKSAVESLISVL